jgi:hypothetical protein
MLISGSISLAQSLIATDKIDGASIPASSFRKYRSRTELSVENRGGPTLEIRRTLGFFSLVLLAASCYLASSVPDHDQKRRRTLAL